jgi:hypothetical protein
MCFCQIFYAINIYAFAFDLLTLGFEKFIIMKSDFLSFLLIILIIIYSLIILPQHLEGANLDGANLLGAIRSNRTEAVNTITL